MKRLSRGLPTLADCGPIANTKARERRMRTAVSRAKRIEGFAAQQSFDRAVAKLVQATPVTPEIQEWFANEKMAEGAKRNWRKTAFHPAILAIGIALVVISVVGGLLKKKKINAFPGTETAKKMLKVDEIEEHSEFKRLKHVHRKVNLMIFIKSC